MEQKDIERELEETANKLSDCWLFLDSIARGEWEFIPIDQAKQILQYQKAPGWKSTPDEPLQKGQR